jgi:hypothetical protein
MSITFWPVLPMAAVAGRILLSRYQRRARHRRCLERLEDAFSYDVPRLWHRDVRQALRSADDWVFAESLNYRRKPPSVETPRLIPLTGEAPETRKSS